MEYRAFELSPGQQNPPGVIGRALKTGESIWYGDDGAFPAEITNRAMTQNEIDWFEAEPAENASLKEQVDDLVDNYTMASIGSIIDGAFSGHTAGQIAILKKLFRVVLYLGKKCA